MIPVSSSKERGSRRNCGEREAGISAVSGLGPRGLSLEEGGRFDPLHGEICFRADGNNRRPVLRRQLLNALQTMHPWAAANCNFYVSRLFVNDVQPRSLSALATSEIVAAIRNPPLFKIFLIFAPSEI